jgi:hypothetical protein
LGHIAGRLRAGAQPNAWDNGDGGVTVTVSGPVTTWVITESDDTYSFSDLPMGTYTVDVPGYSTTPDTIVVDVQHTAPWGRTSFTVN